ncbi:MAG TPA: cysteine desulfurase-like protein [Woeseiaceae bacterium]|nr:cysteine desulfurase-like protein [Woeseiaceae bacterium]
MSFDPGVIRAQFPALSIEDRGRPRYYFDNPAGTQVSQRVVDAMSHCLVNTNANLGGPFETSMRADQVVADARVAMADFLNAPEADEIIFGQNMTTLTLHLSRSIGRLFKPGDEIVLTRMDHDANVHPWLLMARDFDLTVRWLPFNLETFEFDLADLDNLLSERTRLVCVGGASNLLGTLNDVAEISRRSRASGAWTFVDAVQSAPHVASDVQEIGCDFLVCSAYKFFGPHQGILWGRREILEQLEPYKVRPAPDELPWCFETGTQSHEGIAGVEAAVEYFAWVGEIMATDWGEPHPGFSGRRKNVRAGIDCLFDYERGLSKRLLSGLATFPHLKVHGITATDALDRRVPTVSFTHGKLASETIAKLLAKQNIFVWSGHNYAVEAARALGIYDSGGAVRVGPVHYNSMAEIEHFLDALDGIL